MCRLAPGPRCSDHSLSRLSAALTKTQWVEARIAELEEEYKTLKPDSRSAGKNRRILALTQVRAEKIKEAQEKAIIEYNATPAGQADLQARLDDPNLVEEEKWRLELDAAVAKARRQWQSQTMAALRKAEKTSGLGAAIFLAQSELASREEKVKQLTYEILTRTKKQEELEDYSRTPKGRHPSNAPKIRSLIKHGRTALYVVRNNQLLMALITNDLEGYIKRKKKKLHKAMVMGPVHLVAKLIR